VFAASLVLSAVLGGELLVRVAPLALVDRHCRVADADLHLRRRHRRRYLDDLIQFVIYVGGSVLVAYELVQLTPGGWSGILNAAQTAGKLQVFSFTSDLTVPFSSGRV
jgi:hypothetical protein